MEDISLQERPALTDAELNALVAAAWPDPEARTFNDLDPRGTHVTTRTPPG